MESCSRSVTLKCLWSWNWKQLAGEIGKGWFPRGKSGCFHQKEENFTATGYQVRWGPPTPTPGQESPHAWIDTSGAPPPRSQHSPLPSRPFVGSLLAAVQSPGASVLYAWPLIQSSDLTHVLDALVENMDCLECNLLIYMKRELDLWPSSLTSGKPMFSRNKGTTGKVVCSWIFIAALSVVVKKRKNPNFSSVK